MKRLVVLTATLAMLLAPVVPAGAFDAAQTFRRGTYVVSAEGGYGEQFNLQGFTTWSHLKFFNLGVRASLLPFEPLAAGGPLHGAFELGLEPLYQQYTDPKPAFWAGMAAVARYHFLALGRFVPYAEVAAAPGGTDLQAHEIDSRFSFLLWAGVGGSVFLTDTTAVYVGYRYEHNSNGNTSEPNRGWESNVGVVGVSYYFR